MEFEEFGRKRDAAISKAALVGDEPYKVIEGGLKPRKYYLRVAKISKRSAIMESWLEVETAVSDAYEQKVEPGMKVFMDPDDVADFLRGRDQISADDYAVYIELLKLRNKAAHEIDDLDINDALVGRYVDFALDLAAKIRGLNKKTAGSNKGE